MVVDIPLPDEILARIFGFLDSNGKVYASSVSKRWMKVFNDFPRLLEDVCVCFFPIYLKATLKIFSSMTRNFCSFFFKYVTIDEECFLFLERFIPQVRLLTLKYCRIAVDKSRKLRNCRSLVDLKVWGCDAFDLFSHLPALKILHFQIQSSCMRDLVQLQKMTSIYLIHFGMVDLDDRDQEYSSTFYTELQDFIYKRRLSLKYLDFRGLPIPDSVMKNISRIKGLRLKGLRLHPNVLSHGTIESFCNLQQRIVVLNLINNSKYARESLTEDHTPIVTDSTVVAICTFLPRLVELNLSYCYELNESVSMIFQMKFLRKLNLRGCWGITKQSFNDALSGLTCKNLKSIYLDETSIDRSILRELLRSFPNLGAITVPVPLEPYLSSRWVKCISDDSFGGEKLIRRSISLPANS